MLIRYFIILSMIRILFKSISIIPWPILRFLSWVLGHLAILLNVSAYKVTKKNLIYCGFNDEKLIKQSFLYTMELLFEYPYIWGNPNNYKKLVEHLRSRNWKDMRKWVGSNSDIEPTVLYRKLYDTASQFMADRSIPQLVLLIANYSYKSAFVADQEVNFVACLTEIMSDCEFK